MTRKQKAPQKENVTPATAAQSWRDRLNAKRTAQQGGHTRTSRNATASNAGNRSGNSSPASTARKAKKGHRPG